MESHCATLPKLPPELLFHIVDQFSQGPIQGFGVESARTKALHSLSSTCRSLNSFATPLLYQTVGIAASDVYGHEAKHKTREEDPPEALIQLTRTIVSRPDLAKHTKLLSLKLGSRPLVEPSQQIQGRSSMVMRKTSLYAELRLLFQHLPNVQELDFTSDAHYQCFWQDLMAGEVVKGQSNTVLPRLQTFRCMPYFLKCESNVYPTSDSPLPRALIPLSNENGSFYKRRFCQPRTFNFADYQSLFERPNLQHLALTHAASLEKFRWPAISLQPKSLGLTNLEIVRCYVTSEALDTILRACRMLRIFKLDCSNDGRWEAASAYMNHWVPIGIKYMRRRINVPDSSFRHHEMQHALDSCGATLEELALVYPTGHDWKGTLSFRGFQRLRKLMVQWLYVDVRHALLPSLELLTLLETNIIEELHRETWMNIINIRTYADVPELREIRMVGSRKMNLHDFDTCGYLVTKVNYWHPLPDESWEERDEPWSLMFERNRLKIELLLGVAHYRDWPFTIVRTDAEV